METVQFLVQGSAAEPYEVTFVRANGELSALCSCPAGLSGTSCKHRLSIFEGSSTGIVSPNIDEFAIVSGWLAGSEIARHLAELTDAESEVSRAKQRVTVVKRNLAAAMKGRK